MSSTALLTTNAPVFSSDVRTMLADSLRNIDARTKQRNRVAAYVSGSLAAHLAMWAIMSAVPVEDSNVNLTLSTMEATSTRTSSTMTEMTPAELEQPEQGTDSGSAGGGAMAMALTEGAAGKPDANQADGSMKIKNRHSDPAIARQQALEYARSAGFMGDTRSLTSAITSLGGEVDYSSGYDGVDRYGPLVGSDGEGRGNFGMGRKDFGPGGGCYGGHCGTIPGTSQYDTIGRGPGAGDKWGPGGRGGPGLQRRVAQVPDPVGQPREVIGGLDRSVIRRYIKNSTFKISYCYEHELLARADLEGVVMVTFLITPAGTVQSSQGTGFDGKVASCVANVVRNIKFPAPTNGGNVQVNYPFSFRRAAGGR